YRNMLVHERDDGALILGMAVPRAWLADGKQIEVERCPTYYGNLSMTIASEANTGRITASVAMQGGTHPTELIVRLRHPEGKPIRSVSVNGRPWTEFDVAKEWIRIRRPDEAKYQIVASY
ncbi:MAG: hypothetical protein ACREMY_30525, partial [bacterium]